MEHNQASKWLELTVQLLAFLLQNVMFPYKEAVLNLKPVGQVSEGTECEYKKASFHILVTQLSTVITPFYATVVTYAIEEMLFNK